MKQDVADLVDQAKTVLAGNWLGSSTKPAPHLYPHQWNWDSAFIAIGYARYNQQRAQQELSTLFKAQWSNGMLPQIVFNPDALGGYFPEPEFWQGERSHHYPVSVLTSGITMPPVQAMAAKRIWEHAADRDEARSWLQHSYPAIFRMHEHLYRERDPHREGLVYLRHPWESGLDNSPTWDKPLKAIIVDKSALPEYERKDLKKGVPASQRPTDDDYDRYVYLVDLYRRHNYDEAAIAEECPFLLQDPLFNSILIKANEDLLELADVIDADPGPLQDWIDQGRLSMNAKMWCPVNGAYDAYDLRAGRRVGTMTASGFLPMLCGAPDEKQAGIMYAYLESNSFCPMHQGNCFSIPNYNMQQADFDQKNYWRGPVWINTNWLLAEGLERYGFHEKSMSVREDIVELIRRWGFHEYFDPYEGTGYGTENFSWSAALLIDTALKQSRSQAH